MFPDPKEVLDTDLRLSLKKTDFYISLSSGYSPETDQWLSIEAIDFVVGCNIRKAEVTASHPIRSDALST